MLALLPVLVSLAILFTTTFLVVLPPSNFETEPEDTSEKPDKPAMLECYYRSADLLAVMRAFAAAKPDVVTVYELTPSTSQNRTIAVMEIKRDPHFKKSGIFIVAGLDPLVWAAPMTVLQLAYDILYDSDFYNLLVDYDWYLIPTANPDGLDYTLSVRHLPVNPNRTRWSKNPKARSRPPGSYHKNVATNKDSNCFGVNIDRNFAYHWRDTVLVTESPKQMGRKLEEREECQQEYPGDKPFSQAETCSLRQYVDKLAGVVDMSIELEAVYDPNLASVVYPWCYSNRKAGNWYYLQKIAEQAAKNVTMHSKKYVEVHQHSDEGLHSGTLADYQKGVVGTELVFVVKPYHARFAASVACSTPPGGAGDDGGSTAPPQGSMLQGMLDVADRSGRLRIMDRPSVYVGVAKALTLGLVRARAESLKKNTLNFFGEERQY